MEEKIKKTIQKIKKTQEKNNRIIKILLKTKNELELEGTIILLSKEYLQIKLSSGYNIGVEYNNIKEIKILEEKTKKTQEKNKIKKENIKKTIKNIKEEKIVLLHTGGTIASKIDYETGAVHPKINTEELLETYPELEKIMRIETIIVENLLSENIRFKHINKLAEYIKKSLKDKKVKGIIITHGTDTMHYTAAGIKFMFNKINKPIIITGSQRSSDRPSSDAKINLLNAAYIIKEFEKTSIKPNVYILMHKSIKEEKTVLIEGIKARKNHSSRRDAFESINKPTVATIDFYNRKIEENKEYYTCEEEKEEKNTEENIEKNIDENLKENTRENINYKPYNTKIKVGIIKSKPNMFSEEIKFYKNYDGIIIEGTGFGHLPIEEDEENKKIYEEIKKIAEKKPVFMTRQTIKGITNLKVYSAGRKLKKIKVLGDNTDITTEAAYMKLAWLLSNYNIKETKKLMEKNLKGEYCENREIE